MARALSPEKNAEFEELLAFLTHFDIEGWVPPRDPQPDTRAEIERIVSEYGKSKALMGLRQELNDTLEMTSSRSTEWVKGFDKRCREAGVRTLSEYRVALWSKYRRVLGRGKISNHEQFYMLAAIAADTALTVTSEERAKVESMLANYGQRAV